MPTWIALLRGINVGGKNLLPMESLRQDLEALKLKNVRTYIQSGNVLFDSNARNAATLASKIERKLEQQHGFRPQALVLSGDELLDAIESNPYPQALAEPKTLHFFFLSSPATDPHLSAIDKAKKSTEKYSLTDRVFYLYAPDGIARSKLAASVEQHLGVAATARNYRTVDKLRAMLLDS